VGEEEDGMIIYFEQILILLSCERMSRLFSLSVPW